MQQFGDTIGAPPAACRVARAAWRPRRSGFEPGKYVDHVFKETNVTYVHRPQLCDARQRSRPPRAARSKVDEIRAELEKRKELTSEHLKDYVTDNYQQYARRSRDGAS